MTSSWRRTLTALAAMALLVLTVGPAGADTGPPTRPEPGRVIQAEPVAGAAPIEMLATANRMINGAGGTHGKCMEIAGGGSTSSAIQMAPCRSYAHQGWTLREFRIAIILDDGITVTANAFRVESHDTDAAGRCLTYTAQAVQAETRSCDYLDAYWFRNSGANGWFQLESVYAWTFYMRTGDPINRQCLDVHVDTTRTTNVVHHWTCGHLNKGNQLFRVQAA